jgi:hypothetical protein
VVCFLLYIFFLVVCICQLDCKLKQRTSFPFLKRSCFHMFDLSSFLDDSVPFFVFGIQAFVLDFHVYKMSATVIRMGQKGGFLPSIHMLTPYHFKKNKIRTKHLIFFFFSSSFPATALTIFGNVFHFRPNPIGKHRKTQTQSQKSFLMPQNSIIIHQKLFLDSKLKPRF